MDIENLISQTVDEKNEERKEETKRKVRSIVNEIMECQATIKSKGTRVVNLKQELKDMQLPEDFKLEL